MIATLGFTVVSAERCGASTTLSVDAHLARAEAVMTSRQKWGCVWIGWVAYFAVAEYVALRSEEHDAPLSSHMREVLGVKRTRPHRWAGQAATVAGAIWLIDHLYRGVSQ